MISTLLSQYLNEEAIESSTILTQLEKENPSDVCDCFWLCSLQEEEEEEELVEQQETSTTRHPRLKKLYSLINSYVGNSKDRLEILCTNIELETLEKCGLIDLEKARVAIKRANTSQKYRQIKYNLMREESEGYSKLLTELLSESTVEVIYQNSTALIGYFRLDPNRVLDIIIDCLPFSEERLSRVCFTLFPPSSVSLKMIDLISFRLSRMMNVTSRNYIHSIAILLTREMIDFQVLLPHLHMDSFIKACEKLDVIIASGTSITTTTTETGEEKKKEEELVDLFSPIILEELLAATLKHVNGWNMSERIMKVMGPYKRHAFRNPSVMESFQRFINNEISKLYFQECKGNGEMMEADTMKKEAIPCQLHVHTLKDFLEKICPVLISIGPEAVDVRISKNSSLLIRIIRLLGVICRKEKDGESTVDQLLISCIFPAITLLPSSNPVIGQNLWEHVLKEMNYTKRFYFYEGWKNITSSTARPEYQASLKVSRKECMAALKRFCADPAKNLFASRKLSKISHMNPFIAFKELIKTCQMNDNLISSSLACFGFCTQLSLDVLVYLFCDTLVSTKESKIQSDGITLSSWFASTCRLIGETFSEHPEIDIYPLLEVVFDRCVMEGDILILKMFQELVESIVGEREIVDYDTNLLRSCGGGEALRFLSRLSNDADPTKLKSSFRKNNLVRFKGVIEEGDMHIRLLLGIAYRRGKVMYDENIVDLKHASFLYDLCTSILLQFTDFLSSEISTMKFFNTMPSLMELVQKYHLEVAVAFHLHRFGFSSRREAVAGHCKLNNSNMEEEEEKGTLFPGKKVIPVLYQTFWEYSLFDVSLPIEQYDNERDRIRERKKQLESRSNSYSAQSNKKMLSALEEIAVTIKHEVEIQRKRVEAAKVNLKNLTLEDVNQSQNMELFFQYCLVPRLLFSHEDAYFSAKFVELAFLYQENVSLEYFNVTFTSIPRLLISCTEKEAQRIGLFLNENLTTIFLHSTHRKHLNLFIHSETKINEWAQSLTDGLMDMISPNVNNSLIVLLAIYTLLPLPQGDRIIAKMKLYREKFRENKKFQSFVDLYSKFIQDKRKPKEEPLPVSEVPANVQQNKTTTEERVKSGIAVKQPPSTVPKPLLKSVPPTAVSTSASTPTTSSQQPPPTKTITPIQNLVPSSKQNNQTGITNLSNIQPLTTGGGGVKRGRSNTKTEDRKRIEPSRSTSSDATKREDGGSKKLKEENQTAAPKRLLDETRRREDLRTDRNATTTSSSTNKEDSRRIDSRYDNSRRLNDDSNKRDDSKRDNDNRRNDGDQYRRDNDNNNRRESDSNNRRESDSNNIRRLEDSRRNDDSSSSSYRRPNDDRSNRTTDGGDRRDRLGGGDDGRRGDRNNTDRFDTRTTQRRGSSRNRTTTGSTQQTRGGRTRSRDDKR